MYLRHVLAINLLLACVATAHAAETPAVATRPAAAVSKSTPVSVASSAGKPGAAPADKAAKPVSESADQLTLDATTVTGNRELPKVMYIVPWKKATLSDLPGQPFNTLLDEALQPVDREVFRREVDYYRVISAKDQPAADQTTLNPDSR